MMPTKELLAQLAAVLYQSTSTHFRGQYGGVGDPKASRDRAREAVEIARMICEEIAP